MKNVIFTIALFTLCFNVNAQNEPIYSNQESYKALRMTYKDFSGLLLKIQRELDEIETDNSRIRRNAASVKSESKGAYIFNLTEYSFLF